MALESSLEFTHLISSSSVGDQISNREIQKEILRFLAAMSGLFSIFLVGASAFLDPRRSEELGISQSTILQPKWTENGTIYVNRTVNEIERGKFAKPSGCSEMVLFGLYDWDCKSSGKRLLGYWPERTRCQVFCRSGQIMMPKAKKIQCRKNKKNGGKLQWKLKRSWDPDIKCISTYNTAKWSGWSEWSDWTKCSVRSHSNWATMIRTGISSKIRYNFIILGRMWQRTKNPTAKTKLHWRCYG